MSDVENMSAASDRDAEVVETSTVFESEDAQMSADEERKKLSAASDKLLEVEQLVDDLHKIAHELKLKPGCQMNHFDWITRSKIVNFLREEQGLQDLGQASREEARLRILKAWGLVLQQFYQIDFPDDMFGEYLSLPEVNAVSRQLPSSTALKVLKVDYLKPGAAYSPEGCTLLADIILGATVLESLHFFIPAVDGVYSQSHVAKAITSSGREFLSLRTLELEYTLRGADVSWRTSKSFNIELAGDIATLIRAAPNLTQLVIWVDESGDEDGAELIGKAIACHQSLQSLRIKEIDVDRSDEDSDVDECESNGRGIVADTVSTEHCKRQMGSVGHLLSGAFIGSGLPRNTCIHSLHLQYDYDSERTVLTRDFQILSQVLKMRSNLTAFKLCCQVDILPTDLHLRHLLKSLQGNAHIQSLALEIKIEIDADSFAVLVELIKSNSMHSLKHLALEFPKKGKVVTLDWAAFYAALSQNSTFRSLELRGFIGYQVADVETQMLDWIQSTKTLQTLTLYSKRVNWRSIFRCLRQNISIATLKIITGPLSDDDTYREFMGMLQINSSLIKVEFLDEKKIPEERRAPIEEALRSKARQESYLSEFRRGLGQGETKWESPKCGRVFLYGLPEAGKTRLAKTMQKLAKGKSRMARLKEKVLRRTEGIEIYTLRNDDDMQISIWDLAGQDIFRALQQLLFPRLNRASLFIFVFSPYFKDKDGNKKEKSELDTAFEKEFREWLRFIASHSAVTWFNPPQVMVVISHRDMYHIADHIDLMEKKSEEIITRFIKVFQDIILIHRRPYFIDGRDLQQVRDILSHLYSTFTQLFQEKLFLVPRACPEMSQEMMKWASLNAKEPVIDHRTFFSLCGSIPDLKSFSQNIQDDDNKRLLGGVASYLHDIGTVIDLTPNEEEVQEGQKKKPYSNLMVVNPNWLTYDFLGRFISSRHKFQLTPEEEQRQIECHNGFVSEMGFHRWLEPMKKEFRKLTRPTWQGLMESLDLLHVVERGNNDFRFFIPTLLVRQKEDTLEWQKKVFPEENRHISFVGVRLRCKDPQRTYLSPAFFSRFQVRIWRELTQQSQPAPECESNLISMKVDAFDILIEIDEDGDFIDVLIRSTKSRGTIWNYVETHIVEEIRDLCASSKGCPGVELVMDILRPECVERPVVCKHRKTQSVSKEDLKRDLMLSVQNLGGESKADDLYSHTWEGVPQANLERAFQRADALLPPNDVEEVRTSLRGQMQLLKERVDKLENVMTNMGDGHEHFPETSTTREKKTKLGRSVSTSGQEFSPEDQKIEKIVEVGVRKGVSGLREDVQGLREDVQGLREDVRDLKLEIHKMKELQEREMESLTQFYQKLDQIIGASMSTTQWPKRPYFTRKNVSIRHRITALVEIGTPLMLHFQCEEKDGHHFVPDQDGYEIIIGKNKCEVWRQISKNSLQVVCYLLKAGLHVTTGMGDLVQQVETLGGNITLLTSSRVSEILRKVQVEDSSSAKQTQDSCSPEEAWTFLQDFLRSKNLNNSITEFFLLHPAQYFDSTRAWLCLDCLDHGLKQGKLKKLP